MIDSRKPNYSETLAQIEELRCLIEKLERNVSSQLPQNITDKFLTTKNKFFNWVEEVEFTIENYKM